MRTIELELIFLNQFLFLIGCTLAFALYQSIPQKPLILTPVDQIKMGPKSPLQ